MIAAAKPVVIFGAGEIAELAAFYFTHDGAREIAAFTVDRAYRAGDRFAGKPLVDFENVIECYPPAAYDMFVALSYTRINQLRRDKCDAARSKGYALASYVSSRATVFPGFKCGDNCLILEDNTVQPFVAIGRNVTLWSGNHIGHHSAIEDDVFVSSHVVVAGGVTVGRGSFLGINATIRDHLRVGAECVIGAGVTLLHDAPDHAVYKAATQKPATVTSQQLKRI